MLLDVCSVLLNHLTICSQFLSNTYAATGLKPMMDFAFLLMTELPPAFDIALFICAKPPPFLVVPGAALS